MFIKELLFANVSWQARSIIQCSTYFIGIHLLWLMNFINFFIIIIIYIF